LNMPLLGDIIGHSFNTPCPRIVEMKDSANGHAWSYSELGGFHSRGKSHNLGTTSR
jgi:hypothetical protein